ncbi:hypothetical protein L198_07359 [Cryptococcus wingfieldii CBS 7118]|uniref:Oxidase FUB9 n=1 Tax=Cryptococcus wingfieldii CBS 7118 TaxID=1295528 RepID=A0A1E3IDP6_9TREE|nr:hypothetical protein L198_07359 [Cryptococcus wingfieldii CBS 7118]ODN86066.1 hypothetical protein L198_07359 [Cryptococcus wingfieldii CBS 7118]
MVSGQPQILSLRELEIQAGKRLPEVTSEYFADGAGELQQTLRESVEAYARYRLQPRVGRKISLIDARTSIWGGTLSISNSHRFSAANDHKQSFLPIGIAPSAMHQLAHPDGELATSRASSSRGIPMILSQSATASIEDVTSASLNDTRKLYAQQTTLVEDWSANLALFRRAEKAGCKAVVLSVDCSVPGRRLGELRNGFVKPAHLTFPNIDYGDAPDLHTAKTERSPAVTFDRNVTWETYRRVVESTSLEVYLKGILTAEDALLAVAAGVHGIIVSAHGGRQLDGVVPPLGALPGMVDAVGGRIQVNVDGGIRQGSDVFKAFALGADFVWIGRPALWGLAYDGEQGVQLVIDLLTEELVNVMALCGAATLQDITRGHLGRYLQG